MNNDLTKAPIVETGLTLAGWIFVILAWGSIVSATVYCFLRILAGPAGKRKSK